MDQALMIYAIVKVGCLIDWSRLYCVDLDWVTRIFAKRRMGRCNVGSVDEIGDHLIRFDIVTPNVCQHVQRTVMYSSNGGPCIRERRLDKTLPEFWTTNRGVCKG